MKTKLRQIAHSRAGDKGDISNVSLIVYDLKDYQIIELQVDSRRVAEWFAELVKGPIQRYEMPKLGAMNFVMRRALSGGVPMSLALEAHGKTRSSLLLEMEVDIPD